MNTDRSEEDKMGTGREYLFQHLTKEILASAFRVHNALGCGLLKKVYGNAMCWDLKLNNKQVITEKEFKVIYRDREVGVYYADCR